MKKFIKMAAVCFAVLLGPSASGLGQPPGTNDPSVMLAVRPVHVGSIQLTTPVALALSRNTPSYTA
jgi:hypothetical protein